MGDTLTDGLAGADTLDDGPTRTSDEEATFHCPLCGARRQSTAIRYDQLGYAICPACSYAAGP